MGQAEYERHTAPAEPDEARDHEEDAHGAPAADEAAGPDPGGAQASASGEDVGSDADGAQESASGEDVAGGAYPASGGVTPESGDTSTGPDDVADGQGEDQPASDTASAEAEEIRARASQDPEALAVQLIEAERARDQYLDALQRERAEFENFRRRANRERGEALDRGAEGVVAGLLSVLDNFGFVLDAAEQSEDTQLAKGISMVHDELIRALEEAGLERVPGAGSPFDPNHHDAMMQVEAEEEVTDPTVVEVLRPGYRFKGRVLRPASVSVAQ